MKDDVDGLLSFLGCSCADQRPFARALAHGATASNLGEAFYEGYQAALCELLPGLDASARAALCVTEAEGGHPRAVKATLSTDVGVTTLSGEKAFVTGADRADHLFVVAREGVREDGTPRLRVVRLVQTHGAWPSGVYVSALPPTPFAPNVRHARVRLVDVEVAPAAILPGDGYLGYVRPFRTVEDIHVVGAIAAFLVALTRSILSERPRTERLLAGISALDALASRSPAAPNVHLALAGALEVIRGACEGLVESLDGHTQPLRMAEVRRDLALLRVAEGARRVRSETAWRALDPRAAKSE